MRIGVTHIEERLRQVARRANTSAALRAGGVALTGLALAGAAAVGLGATEKFDAASLAGGTTLLVVAAAAAVGLALRRSWQGLAQAAELVDRKARLSGRLSTLVALRRQGTASRLMPVLVSQSVASLARWTAPQVVPFEFPRSAWTALAALLLLVASFYLRPSTPRAPNPSTTASTAPAPAPEPRVASEVERPGEGGKTARDRASSTDAARHDAPGSAGRKEPSDGEGEQAPGRGQPAARAMPDSRGGSLPENQPDARPPLRQPQLAAAEVKPDGAGRGEGKQAAQEPPRVPQDPGAGEGRAERGEHGDGASDASGRKAEGDTGAPHASGGRGASGSGRGTSPGGVFGANGAPAAGSGGDAPATFRLTLRSFLQSTAPRRTTRGRERGREGSADLPGGDPAPAVPRDTQLEDDALRRAEVPIEYEDVVRRVYSARTQP